METQKNIENCGENFDESVLIETQQKTWKVLGDVAAQIKPGMTEEDGHAILKSVLADYQCEKQWHPAKIRFGQNTLKPFRFPSEPGIVLRENDIFFLDIGPIFNGYEGDAGRTFLLGEDEEMKNLIRDNKVIFDEVQKHWRDNGVSGAELYRFAERFTAGMGYRLNLEGASGHRISDFPHAVHFRGRLTEVKTQPSPNRWILEIQIAHHNLPFGAFYEDIMA